MNRERSITQIMFEFRNGNLCDPLAGGLAASLLTDLGEIFGRNAEFLCIPLYFTLVRMFAQHLGKGTEDIIAGVD